MSATDLVCDRCDSPLEIEDLRCPVCNRAAPLAAPKDAPEAEVEVMRCDSCGAAVTYSVRELAPACVFCGSVTRLEVPKDPLEQTGYFLPMTVKRDQAVAAYKEWLGGLGWFRPADLGSASSLESLTPLWWVGWVFWAHATVSWTADSDLGARRADWAPHAGQVELEFDHIVAPASRGLSADETECPRLQVPGHALSNRHLGPGQRPHRRHGAVRGGQDRPHRLSWVDRRFGGGDRPDRVVFLSRGSLQPGIG